MLYYNGTIHNIEILDVPIINGWLGYSVGIPAAYFEDTITRDQVRRTYTKLRNVDFNDIQARQIK